MPKQVGTRVILNSLLEAREFTGEIIAINELSGLCLVKLDKQVAPVTSVLWFDKKPEIVNSTLWQICYPIEEEPHEDPDK